MVFNLAHTSHPTWLPSHRHFLWNPRFAPKYAPRNIFGPRSNIIAPEIIPLGNAADILFSLQYRSRPEEGGLVQEYIPAQCGSKRQDMSKNMFAPKYINMPKDEKDYILFGKNHRNIFYLPQINSSLQQMFTSQKIFRSRLRLIFTSGLRSRISAIAPGWIMDLVDLCRRIQLILLIKCGPIPWKNGYQNYFFWIFPHNR